MFYLYQLVFPKQQKVWSQIVWLGRVLYTPSFTHQHRSHYNTTSCIWILLLKQSVCKKKLCLISSYFSSCFSPPPTWAGKSAGWVSLTTSQQSEHSRENRHLFKERWVFWEFDTEFSKGLASSCALVEQLGGRWWRGSAQGSAPLWAPITVICSGSRGWKDGSETSACSPSSQLICMPRAKTWGDSPASWP